MLLFIFFICVNFCFSFVSNSLAYITMAPKQRKKMNCNIYKLTLSRTKLYRGVELSCQQLINPPTTRMSKRTGYSQRIFKFGALIIQPLFSLLGFLIDFQVVIKTIVSHLYLFKFFLGLSPTQPFFVSSHSAPKEQLRTGN